MNEAEVRAEVRAWLAENWDPALGLVEWRTRLAHSGWGMPTWPKRWYGREMPEAMVPVIEPVERRIRLDCTVR